jgi:KDO2-lipid IV(A) lauroyltransferase
VNGVVASDIPAPTTGTAARTPDAFWLDAMFRLASRAPRLTRAMRPALSRAAFRATTHLQDVAAANARRIFGPDVSPQRVQAYGRGVVANFYDFVCDVGAGGPPGGIESIEGREHYDAARTTRKGAIIATAHMGSFEAGAAAVVERERPGTVHVVFKRDATRFERVRSSLRDKLGVIEAPVDEGWTLWLRLRDALMRDEVVMVQADRVMPGQKGLRVPFLHGHMELPTGPVKLALASSAPILPVFAVRTPDGRIRIHIEPAIVVEDIDAAMSKLAAVIERYVRDYPEQWLLFHKAFSEDADG